MLRLDFLKLDNLHGKILWYFSFVELIHILLVLILIFSQAAVSVVPLLLLLSSGLHKYQFHRGYICMERSTGDYSTYYPKSTSCCLVVPPASSLVIWPLEGRFWSTARVTVLLTIQNWQAAISVVPSTSSLVIQALKGNSLLPFISIQYVNGMSYFIEPLCDPRWRKISSTWVMWCWTKLLILHGQ